MSQRIDTAWTCFACETKNEINIEKPNVITARIASPVCSGCGSHFTIRFIKRPGEHRVDYFFLHDNLSPTGEEKHRARQKKVLAEQKITTNLPKGGSNANARND